ncbi:MAG: hypothetical protein KDD43_03935 [Bdellovibrionales bacterium]|nr:hypothetical protein [Bdellovibrionales bacterium]
MNHNRPKDLHQLFERARQAPLDPPPYMGTRVVAALRSRGQKKRLWFWQALSFTSLGATLCLAWILFQAPGAQFEAQVDNPYVVRVELNELSEQQYVEAEIVLPQGVEFYSKNHPELSAQRTLRLVWNQETGKPFLPFVIKGAEDGKKQILVKFFDESNRMISSRQIAIEFLAAVEKG